VLASYAETAPTRFCFASCSPQNDQEFELDLLRTHIPPKLLAGVLGGNFLSFLES
jgi:hypothetical protein